MLTSPHPLFSYTTSRSPALCGVSSGRWAQQVSSFLAVSHLLYPRLSVTPHPPQLSLTHWHTSALERTDRWAPGGGHTDGAGKRGKHAHEHVSAWSGHACLVERVFCVRGCARLCKLKGERGRGP